MPDSLDRLFSHLETDKLPSLPHVLVVLLDASHTEIISFDRLSELIKKDAALSARIVGAASTAYYGGQGKFLTFERTLVLLGLDTIKTIAITASVQQFFSRFDSTGSRRLKRFWRRSLSCAYIAKTLANLIGYEFEDEAYLAGLMHDIGELIFANNYPTELDAAIERSESREQLLTLETEYFGGHRYQAGAWLVKGWELDSFMADAIFYQNAKVEEVKDAHPLVKIVYLASHLARFTGKLDDTGFQVAEQLFDLNQSMVQEIYSEAQEKVVEAAHAMEIDIDSAELGLQDYAESVTDDQDKQIELAERVRNIALLDGVRSQLASSEEEAEVFNAVQRGLNILFGTRVSGVFLLDPVQNKLLGRSNLYLGKALEDFSIDLDSQSIISRSLSERRACSTLELQEESLVSVVDRQLATLFSSPHIMCFPMLVDENLLGTLVVPSQIMESQLAERQMRLLSMFANEGSQHLHKVRQQAIEDQQRGDEERDYYHARAREIVHEVNNPLSIIKNYVHILGSKLNEGEHAEELNLIREELDRAGNILVKLPGITDRPTSDTGEELVKINTLILDLLKVFRASLFTAAQIESVTDLDDQLPPIACDRALLKQILTNLIKNAVEELNEAGRILVATKGMVNFNGKNYVEILVEDNGTGIPEEIQANLFSPVETTKGGSHAGLGLTIVKSLLDRMGGFISCRSDSTGTRFELLIPRILQ